MRKVRVCEHEQADMSAAGAREVRVRLCMQEADAGKFGEWGLTRGRRTGLRG